jgi:hypothetical protein
MYRRYNSIGASASVGSLPKGVQLTHSYIRRSLRGRVSSPFSQSDNVDSVTVGYHLRLDKYDDTLFRLSRGIMSSRLQIHADVPIVPLRVDVIDTSRIRPLPFSDAAFNAPHFSYPSYSILVPIPVEGQEIVQVKVVSADTKKARVYRIVQKYDGRMSYIYISSSYSYQILSATGRYIVKFHARYSKYRDHVMALSR